MLGVLSESEVGRILRTQQIGRLGVFGDERVYIFPLGYGYDGDALYLHSHEGLKVQLMRRHPEVCFEVEEVSSPADWRTVMVHGTFEELTDPRDRYVALALIASQGHDPAPPSAAPYMDGPDNIICYRIRPTEITGRYERDEVFPRWVV